MATNAEGASRKTYTDNYADWAAFDRLPKAMRQAIANAPFPYDVFAIAQHYAENTSHFFGVSTSEYVRNMEHFFRNDVMRDSFTKAERNGTYILTKRVRRGQKRNRPNILPRHRKQRRGLNIFQ